MKNIQKGTHRTGGLPGLMAGNVVSSLSARLQEVTERFRKEQGDYLKCEFHCIGHFQETTTNTTV